MTSATDDAALPAGGHEPWISLLVPVFNAGPYLARCLDSLFAQGLAGAEVICLDDGSTDGSAETLHTFAAAHPGTLRLLESGRRQGVGAARNQLLAAARGEFVWFVDADDEMRPGALDDLRAVIATHRPDLVLCDFAVLREHVRLRHRWRGEAHRRTFGGRSGCLITDRSTVLAGLFARGEFHVWSKIVRQAAWPADLRFPVGRYFEDLALVPALVMACERTVHVPRPWIGYRSHPGSALGSIDAKKLDDWWAALRTMGSRLAERRELDPQASAAMADFIATSFVRMRKVAAARGLGPDWGRARGEQLRSEGWMPRGLLGAHYRRTGRWWRWVQARALGLD